MKKKSRLFAIVVFFLICIWLLPIIANPFPYTGLDWLSLQSVTVAQYGYGGGEEKDVTPPQPPDQVEPGQGRSGVFDPQTPDITFDFPPGAVDVPVEVRAYHAELSPDVPAPQGDVVGAPFLFGAWIRGQGETVSKFNKSVVINVKYESDSSSEITPNLAPNTPPTSPPVENLAGRLRLSMYDPTTQEWVKSCSRVDPYANRVSGAVVLLTPLEGDGNTLMAMTIDNTPVLNQTVDELGKTTLSVPGSNFSFDVLPGTVEVGTYFQVTSLLNAPDSASFKLLPTPVDVKACQADYTSANKVRQITQFAKPIGITFDFDANTLTRAGGKDNLTIVGLGNGQWADLEEFGANVVRGNNTIAVDSGNLGTFSLAVR